MNEKSKIDELHRIAYETVNQHWLHAENIRWTILSNFLTGNSIFILAWVAILASSIDGKEFLLRLTALAGLILSGIWIAIEVRSSIFVNQYSLLGKHLEEKLSIKEIGAFNRSVALRVAQRNPPEENIPVVEPKITYGELQKVENGIEQLLAPFPTYLVVLIIPAVFIAVYIALFIFSAFII